MELTDATPEWLDAYFKKFHAPSDVSESIIRYLNGQYLALDGQMNAYHYIFYVFDFRLQSLLVLKRMEYDNKEYAREQDAKYGLNQLIASTYPNGSKIVLNWGLLRQTDEELYIEGKLDANYKFIPGYGHSERMAIAVLQLIEQKCFIEVNSNGRKISKAEIIRFCLKHYGMRSLNLCNRKKIINSLKKHKNELHN